jgi:hypothetical protein
MANRVGTNFQTQAAAGVKIQFCDDAGNATFVFHPTASVPTAGVGYAIGCIAIDTTSGIPYVNTGTVASATWTKISGT